MSQPCQRSSCIALAVAGSVYCAVHRVWTGVDRVLGIVRPIVPVTDQIERDADGLPVRFYPETHR